MRYILAAMLAFWGIYPNAVFAQSADKAKTLRFYNKIDYMVPEVLEDFTKETGIKIESLIYDNTAEMMKVMQSGETFDVLVPSHFVLPALIDDGYLQPLDKKKLPNLKYSNPRLMTKLTPFDPQHHYAAPFLWGIVGIAINRPLAQNAFTGQITQSWDLLFTPRLTSRFTACGVSTLDAANEILAILLNYKGHSLKRSSPRRIEQEAAIVLNALRPNLRHVDNERYRTELAQGKLCLAIARSGEALQAQKAGQAVDFFIPLEGSVIFMDTLVIPVNAPNSELAYSFINYMMRPEIVARLSEELFFANYNLEAAQFINPELVKNPAIYPTADIMRRLYMVEPLSEKQQAARDRIWSDFTRRKP